MINDKQLPTSIKANILQFVDLLINESLSLDKYKQAYVQGLKDNLPLIITQVTDNKSNLYSTYLSLFNISQHFKMDCHGFVSQFDSNMLTDKDIDLIKRNEEFTKSDINDDEPLVRAWKILLQCKHECQFERAKLLEHSEYIDDIVDEDLLFSIRENQTLQRLCCPNVRFLSAWKMIESTQTVEREFLGSQSRQRKGQPHHRRRVC